MWDILSIMQVVIGHAKFVHIGLTCCTSNIAPCAQFSLRLWMPQPQYTAWGLQDAYDLLSVLQVQILSDLFLVFIFS